MADFNSSLPIKTEVNGDVVVKVADSTIPAQQLKVNLDGSVNITDNGGSLTIDQANHNNLNANANIQVNDIDVSNTNPVPVSDAGGSITIDNVNLVSIDGKIANSYGLSSSAVRTASQLGNSTGAADFNAGITGPQTLRSSVNITRNGTELSYNVGVSDSNTIRTASIVHDGINRLVVNPNGSINVVPLEDPGTEIVNYNTVAVVAAGASSNHDLIFTTASKLYQIWTSASGKIKMEVQIETGSATNIFNTVSVGFNSASDSNINFTLSKYAAIPAGARVRVIRTNRDNQAQDVYSTIVALQS